MLDLLVARGVDPPRPFNATRRLVDLRKPRLELLQAHRGVAVGVHAHVIAQQPLPKVERVVRAAAAVDMSVKMPAAVRHALPVDHGIVAQHDFLAVDLEHTNGRLDDKSIRHRRLRPVFVVVARQQMDVLACNAL